MTATPTPLRELSAKWRRLSRYEEEDGELSVGDESAIRLRLCADELEAALSARDEAGAVGSAYDGLCPCCGEIECEEPATPPASGEAVTIEATDLGAVMDYEIATAPAASGVEYHHEQIGGGAWVVAASDRGTWLYNFGYGEQAEIFAAGIAKLLNDELRRLAAVAPAGMDGWQPIAEAAQLPRDAAGCTGPCAVLLKIDIGRPGPFIRQGRFDVCAGGFICDSTGQVLRDAIAFIRPKFATPPATAGEEGPKRCDLGMGCDEAGVCFASAHGQPDRCPRGIE